MEARCHSVFFGRKKAGPQKTGQGSQRFPRILRNFWGSAGRFCRKFHIVKSLLKRGSAEPLQNFGSQAQLFTAANLLPYLCIHMCVRVVLQPLIVCLVHKYPGVSSQPCLNQTAQKRGSTVSPPSHLNLARKSILRAPRTNTLSGSWDLFLGAVVVDHSCSEVFKQTGSSLRGA